LPLRTVTNKFEPIVVSKVLPLGDGNVEKPVFEFFQKFLKVQS